MALVKEVFGLVIKEELRCERCGTVRHAGLVAVGVPRRCLGMETGRSCGAAWFGTFCGMQDVLGWSLCMLQPGQHPLFPSAPWLAFALP